MHQVLLVDDEYFDLRGLEQLVPWEQLNLKVAAAVHSGFDALNVIKEQRIDILLTDIHMPFMSGLELAEKAKEFAPDIKIIFISGYDDFQFAKKAIAMNAISYVLKPVDDNELEKALRQTVSELNHLAWTSKRNQEYERSLPYVRRELLYKWLEGKSDIEEAHLPSELREAPNLARRIVLFEIDDLEWKLDRYNEQERAAIADRTRALLIDYIESSGLGEYCYAEAGRIALVVDAGHSDLPVLDRALEIIRTQSPLTVTAGLSELAWDAIELRRAYKEARAALSHKMFLGKNKIIPFADTLTSPDQDVRDMNRILNDMFRAMATYQLVRIDDGIEQLFAYANGFGQKWTVYNFSVYLISKIDAFLHTLNDNIFHLLDAGFTDFDVVFRFETVNDIKSWLRRKLFAISELLQEKQQSKHKRLIANIEQFVAEHLEQAVSLREVAEHLALTPNYVGTLYKDETGENFSNFLIRKRVERASELIRTTKLKIYEIAERLGYTNITYFNRQFKEYYDMTPGEFRRKC